MKLPVLLLALQISLFVFGQDTAICYIRDDRARIREHNADFIKMVLDVKFETKAGKVIGKVNYDFKPIQPYIDTLFLDAPSIAIQKVMLDGQSQPFTTDSAGLTVRFNQRLNWNTAYKLEISYEAQPRKGIYFIGWNVDAKNETDDKYFTRQQIWTQGQGIDNRHWIPCYDDVNDKMLTETIITFDSAYTVISNGVLKSKKANADKTFTWHYRMNKPMVPYLIMLAIDKYAYKDYKSTSGMTSRQYYYADRPETAEPTYQYSSQMMDWMVEQTGVPYPWQTYANIPVQDFMYGAMENTTATIFGDFYLSDKRCAIERPYVSTNTHELAHQWFGDYITEYSATHHWLHESFATYYAKQFIHHIHGENRYEADRRGEQWSAIYADRNNRFPVAHSQGGSARHYPKGSAVIDMLRYIVGDSVFQKTISNYLKKHAYSLVTTQDFKMAFMETAGMNLDWFFDQWIYRSGFPNYEVRYERQNDKVALFISQTQTVDELTSYFKMPVFIELHFTDGGSSTVKSWITGPHDTVYVNASTKREINFALFDPGSNIIKTITFPKTYRELAAQAEKAKHLMDRYDALVALRDTAIETKIGLLTNIFNKGDYYTLLNEIVYQVAKDSSAASVELLGNALIHKNFLVRRAVIDNLESFPGNLLVKAEVLLNDTSYYTIENTLRKLCALHPENKGKYLEEVKGVAGINNNLRISWLELSLKDAEVKTTEWQEMMMQLIRYSSNQFEFRTRSRAIESLERFDYFNEALAKNLFDAATSSNGRLSNPAFRTLKQFLKKKENMLLAKEVYALHVWAPWQQKIIEPLLN